MEGSINYLIIAVAVFIFYLNNMSDSAPSIDWVEVKGAAGVPSTRSSHGISVIGNRVYLYGGEHEARTPIDSKVYIFDFDDSEEKAWVVCEPGFWVLWDSQTKCDSTRKCESGKRSAPRILYCTERVSNQVLQFCEEIAPKFLAPAKQNCCFTAWG